MSKEEIIALKDKQIAELQDSLAVALRRISDLEMRLSQNSRNSSRPPSSDGLTKKPAFPRSSGGKQGGQKGHRGDTLKMVGQVNKVVVHRVEGICCCGSSLSDVAAQISSRRQVFDLPPQALIVTEHQCETKVCTTCGQAHQGTFPHDISAPVQYGKGIKALVSLLSVGHNMSVGGIKSLFTDLFGYSLNEATIQSANALYYEQLQEDEALVRNQIIEEDVAHFDESGLRTEGKVHWLHVACSKLFTYFFVHTHRGKQALQDQASVLAHFTGRAVHDCWASYFSTGDYRHAICGAHLLRELTALIEQGSQWAKQMHELLMKTYLISDKGRSCLTEQTLQVTILNYKHILAQADREDPPPNPGRGDVISKPKGAT